MISERDLRLAKAIVDPYIGQDIIATAVLGTKLGSMLNENAYHEVVNNAQRLIDGTECIPQGKTLEFILRKRYVETIKADRKSDLSLSKMRGLLKGNRAVARDDYVPRLTACCREARMLSADSSFCVAYVEPPFRSFELSERKFGPIECGILESTEPPLNLVESSQRSSLSERVRPFAKTLGLFQLTGAARPLSFFIVSH